jgi:pimeloyl-ACP methyl ester carboxylesterase
MKGKHTVPRVFILISIVLPLAGCRVSQPEPGPLSPPAPLNQPEQKLVGRTLTTQEHEVVLFVREFGVPDAGRYLIAINGSGAVSSDCMRDLEQFASSDLSIVTYDQRGLGGPDAPPEGSGGYDLESHASDVEAIRQALGVDRVHVLGHSWGGLIAMQYAIDHPDRVESLVLLGSAGPDWDTLRAGHEAEARRIRELQEQGYIPDPLPDDPHSRFDAEMVACFSDPTFTPPPADGTDFDFEVQRKITQAIYGYDLTGELGALELPVLIMLGEDDPIIGQLDALVPAFANAQLETILLPDCGHFWYECPDAFWASLSEFLGLVE